MTLYLVCEYIGPYTTVRAICTSYTGAMELYNRLEGELSPKLCAGLVWFGVRKVEANELLREGEQFYTPKTGRDI